MRRRGQLREDSSAPTLTSSSTARHDNIGYRESHSRTFAGRILPDHRARACHRSLAEIVEWLQAELLANAEGD